MGSFIGPALLARLVADKTQKPPAEVEQVLSAYDDLVVALLKKGAKVRVLQSGYFEVIQTKATRRKSPLVKGYVKIPAKKKIVFRTARKK